MRLSLSLTALLVGVLALAPQADAQRRAVSPEQATHSITLQYAKIEARMAPVTLEIAPLSERARAPWGGDIEHVALYTDKGHIILIDEFLSSGHTTGVRAETMVPAGETVLIIFVRGEQGSTVGWTIEDWPEIRDMDWSVIEYQDGTDFAARPRADRAQSGEMQNSALCNGIVDPWTGECFDEIRDPWGVKVDDQLVTIEI